MHGCKMVTILSLDLACTLAWLPGTALYIPHVVEGLQYAWH